MTTDYATFNSKLAALASLESERGYLKFLDHVVVDSQPRKKPFRQIAESWQWDRAVRSAPAIDHLAGVLDHYEGPKSFWNGYHKGSDKTHDTAREICWLLGWSRRRLNLYVCAGSEDQAALMTEAMKGIVLDNPWVAERVRVTDLTAQGDSGSELTILSMNAYTSQGVFPDYLVAEEITHWMYDEGRKFWDFILSSVNKRPDCVLKVCTNAGHVGSWQWEERNRTAKSRFWSFYEAPVGDPLPKWMNQEKIADDSQGMEPGERDRLYKNRWIDPGEEYGFLTLAEAEACVDSTLQERSRGERGQFYFAVLDYGGVTDRCALTVMHTEDGTDQAVIDRMDCWQGTHSDRVAINTDQDRPQERSVEGWLDAVRRNFLLSAVVLDPHQLEGLAIKLERSGLRVIRFEWRGGKNNHRMAQLLKTSIQNRKLRWSPDAGRLPKSYVPVPGDRPKAIEDDTFAKELSMLVVKPMAYGYRFDHESGRHDDRACAVGMGLVFAFPETMPGGGAGPTVVKGPQEYPVIGIPPRKEEPGPGVSVDPMSTWGLFGMQGGGSAWERGDISGNP